MLMERALDGDFRLELDQPQGTLYFEPTGYWSHATVDRWEAAFCAVIEAHNARAKLRLLVDLRVRKLHSQDVAVRVQNAIARHAPHFERNAIILQESALMALQSRRLSSSPGVADEHQCFFGSGELDAARTWLNE
jgi:hypothetical protein